MHCRFAWVCMYVYPQLAQCNLMLVYVYPQRLCNTILCSRMYICHACTTIVQFSCQNVSPGTNTPPDYCLTCVAHIPSIEEHNQKHFKSLPCSLRIAYNFSNALKIHLNVCRVCFPLNDQIRYQGCLVCQMAAQAELALVLTAIPYAEWHALFKASTPPVLRW